MMKLKFTMLSVFFVLSSLLNYVAAQNLQVTGKVTQSTNEQGLQGVSIQLKKGKASAITDKDGNFTISIPPQGGTLLVSYLGMVSQEKTVTNAGVVNFALEENNAKKALEEVVVIGFGTKKRKDLSTAISSISSKEIAKIPVADAGQALQGKVAGVTIV